MGNPTAADEVLRSECAVFCRYLLGRPPDEYILRKYLLGHRHIPFAAGEPPSPLDRFLVGFGRRGVVAVRLADSYARLTRPAGMLRQKLVLLLALLENSPASHREMNAAAQAGRFITLLELGAAGLGFAVALIAGAVLIGPVHLALRLGGK